MHNSYIINNSFTSHKLDQDDDNQSFYNLKQKMQRLDYRDNQHNSRSGILTREEQMRNYNLRSESYSRQKQPTNYSLYKKINSSQVITRSDLFTNQALESVKNYLSIQYASVLNVPIIKISSKQQNRQYEEPSITQILWAKYQIKKEKYSRSRLQQYINCSNKVQVQSKMMPSTSIKSQAVKNLQRKIKSSQQISNKSQLFDEKYILKLTPKKKVNSTNCNSFIKTTKMNTNTSFN